MEELILQVLVKVPQVLELLPELCVNRAEVFRDIANKILEGIFSMYLTPAGASVSLLQAIPAGVPQH
jgi:hypothetical protein